MARITIELADEQHERLRQLAKQKGVRVSQLLNELSNIAVAQFDAETRFRALARCSNFVSDDAVGLIRPTRSS